MPAHDIPVSAARKGVGPRKDIGPILALPAFFIFAGLVLWPMLLTIYDSGFSFNLAGGDRHFVGLANYQAMLGDSGFWLSLRNNVFILVGSVVFQVGLGTIIAAILDRGIKRGTVLLRTIVFAPMVMSMVAVSLLWSMIYHPLFGLIPEFARALGVGLPSAGILGDPATVNWAILAVSCWQYTGFIMVIVLAGMQAVPEELYQAARLDGARGVKAFVHITLPGIRNVLIVATLITMIGAFKVFDLVYVLTGGGPGNASQVLGTYIYENAFTLGRMGYASALAVVLMTMAIALGVVQLRVSRSTVGGR
jgi:ABC-type sugar transport system permease subunit